MIFIPIVFIFVFAFIISIIFFILLVHEAKKFCTQKKCKKKKQKNMRQSIRQNVNWTMATGLCMPLVIKIIK